MKKSICLISSILLFMSGCLYDDDETSTTALSQTEVVAKAPTSVGSSGLVGKTVTFNPTIEFVTDSNLSYSNTIVGDYPVVQGTVYGTIEIDESNSDPDKLSLKININGDVIGLSFGFTDRGGEGYIDEAVLDEVKVNDEVKALPAKVTVAIDAGTVRNENVTAESLADLTGAPTVEEWNNYIVGTAMLITGNSETSSSSTTEKTLVYFTTSSSGSYIDLEDSETGSFSYTYTPTVGATNLGELSVSSDWSTTYIDSDYPDVPVGTLMRDEFVMDLTFEDFYNGTREDRVGGTTTDLASGKVYSGDTPETGDFKAITNVSLYLANN
jgi:hypothetical protein